MKYGLILLNGSAPGSGLTIDPDQHEITLGRDAVCELPLDDNHCSRLHARIWFDSRCWQIEDCGSSNGTFVNARRIDRAVLRPGDVIRVGESLIVFSREHAADEALGQARRLASSTFMMRVAEPDQQADFTAGLLHEGSGLEKSAAVLCQLSQQLHQQDSRDAIVRLVSEAVVQATDAETVTVWLAGSDGRLTAMGNTRTAHAAQAVPVFASLAIENNEAMLVQNGNDSEDSADLNGSDPQVTQSRDTLITVPIPGRSGRCGAIECGRSFRSGVLGPNDLNIVIAIAHQTSLALENFDHRERLELANQHLRSVVHGQNHMVGRSPAMKHLLETISRVAPVDSTVLIHGESGTGKELVARMIHDANARHAGPYIPINCAAFSESLLESELFGHEKGAFTGADQRRRGQFERAHRGTLFLDEIGEMSAACQARLLRILEKHPFERVGGTESIHVDVRVVAATHRSLPDLVADGRFREDLFFRLKVIEVQIPPLRDRGNDVLILAEHFLHYFRQQMGRGPERFSAEALQAVQQYAWPGNVREFRNAIERAVVLGQGTEVELTDLGLPNVTEGSTADRVMVSLAIAERRHILSVLEQVGGNKTQACKVLGIGRGTLYKKLEEYNGPNSPDPAL